MAGGEQEGGEPRERLVMRSEAGIFEVDWADKRLCASKSLWSERKAVREMRLGQH